jgi:hypothetical protein
MIGHQDLKNEPVNPSGPGALSSGICLIVARRSPSVKGATRGSGSPAVLHGPLPRGLRVRQGPRAVTQLHGAVRQRIRVRH